MSDVACLACLEVELLRDAPSSALARLPFGPHFTAPDSRFRAADMRIHPLLYGLLAYMLSCASATALTYKLAPNEKACFFTYVEQKNAKVAFYFAVSQEESSIEAPWLAPSL